ncbi:PKD domain-containing protein [Halobacteriales archaeon Cl-PHB]
MTKLRALTLVWLVVLAIAATTVVAGSGTLTVGNAELAPTTAAVNEPVTVSADVTNPAEETVTTAVELTANSSTIASQGVTLAAGETTTVSFTPSFDTPGRYELVIEGTVAGTLTVEPAPSAELRVTNARLAEPAILEDRSVAVEATVENRGDAEGTATFELTADGVVMDTTTVTVPAAESTTVPFEPRFEDPGTYDVAVEDVPAGSLTVTDDPALIENCTTITAPGQYRLGEDLTAPADATACIAIESSNVSLDGQGYVVDGTVGYEAPKQSVHYGIAIRSPAGDTVSNVSITDLTVTEWTHGVDVRDAADVRITDVTAEHNRVGIVFDGTARSAVDGSVVSDSAKHGVRVKGHSDQIGVYDSSITRSGDRGIFVSVANATLVQGVHVTDHETGILVQDAVDTVVRDNTFAGNNKTGIRLRSTNGTQLLANDVRGGTAGIVVTASHGDGHSSDHDTTDHEDDGCEDVDVPPGSTYAEGNTIADVTGIGISVIDSDGDTFADTHLRNVSSWAFRGEGGASDLTVRELWMGGAVAVCFDGTDVAVQRVTEPSPLPPEYSVLDVAFESELTSTNGSWRGVGISYAGSVVDEADVDESAIYAWRHDDDWALLGNTTGWQYDGHTDAWIPLAVEGNAVDTETNRVGLGNVEPGLYALLAGHPTTTSISVEASVNSNTVDDGEPVSVNATADYDGTGDVAVRFDLMANGAVVDSRTVTVGNERVEGRFTPRFAPGEYEVAVSGVTAGTVTVRDVTAPVADAGSDREVEVGETVEFVGSGSTDDVGITNHGWTFGDGSTATGPTVSHSFDASGTYDVELTVEDAAGNADTDVATVLVAPEAASGGGGAGSSTSGASSSPPPAADIALVDATLETPAIPAGESAVISATLRNAGDAEGEFSLGLLVDGSLVESTQAAVPAGETVTVNLTYRFDTAGEYDLAVNDLASDTLLVRVPDATPEPEVTPTPDEPPTDEAELPTFTTDDETPAADPGSDGGLGLAALALIAAGLAAIAALALRR